MSRKDIEPSNSQTCRICGVSGPHPRYRAREMMFGTREVFEYFKCERCGCLQLLEFPAAVSRYYPAQYFSFSKRCHPAGTLRAFVDRRRVAHALGKRNFIGAAASGLAKRLDYLDWLSAIPAVGRARILDVGCGCGRLLLRMQAGGIGECIGLDPYIGRDLEYPGGVRVYKQDLVSYARSCSTEFDLIMFHHSLEHLPNPHEIVEAATRLLSTGGSVLIRIPVVDSEAWNRYHEHWYQIDAPRHFFLHSTGSMAILSRAAGLRIEKVLWDSTVSQFTVSEMYRRDIAMNEGRPEDVLSSAEIRGFRDLAKTVNREGRGDMAAFFLKRAG